MKGNGMGQLYKTFVVKENYLFFSDFQLNYLNCERGSKLPEIK